MSLLNDELRKQALEKIRNEIQPTFRKFIEWFKNEDMGKLNLDKKRITYENLFSMLEKILTESMLNKEVEIAEREFAEGHARQQRRISVLEKELALVMAKVEKLTPG